MSAARRRRGRDMSSAYQQPAITDLTGALSPELHLRPADLESIADDLAAYHARFAPLFARQEQRDWAEVYLRGLLVADVPRKNVEAMALRLLGAGPGADCHVRALQHFVGEGAWDDDAILAEHQRDVDETLGEADGVLIIDRSEEHTSELQSQSNLVCRLLLEKKKKHHVIALADF